MKLRISHVQTNEVVVIVLSSKTYQKQELEVVKYLAKNYKTICYVNVNRQFNSLVSALKKSKIDIAKFLFIDSITEKPEEGHNQCIYLGSPQALTTLSTVIKKSLSKQSFDSFLLDSLSSLLSYHDVETLTKFTHDLFTAVRKSGAVSVFVVSGGTNDAFMADISMFADHVVEVKK
jgi:hypothetical protein